MKKLFLPVLVLVAVVALANTKTVAAAEVVGTESYEASWHGTQSADDYQLYFGQTDSNSKENTLWGFDNRSKSVKLNHLKPCTNYSWNLRVRRGGDWSWMWASDQSFMTGGVCPVAETGAVGTKITTATGMKTIVVGSNSATATWSTVDGATGYNVYYRAAGDTGFPYAAHVPAGSTQLTINYLGAGSYYYQVAAMVNGVEVWQAEQMLK